MSEKRMIYDMETDSKQYQQISRKTIGDYVNEGSAIAHALDEEGVVGTDELTEIAKRVLEATADAILKESRHPFVQAALCASVGASLLATYDAMVDCLRFEVEVNEFGADGDE